ncbi:MAG: PAS domain-containing protein [Acidobacteriia bacterium]|nr:PAS domain-containing protein [Terriglobia bacterium]
MSGDLPTSFAPAERLDADELSVQNRQLRSHALTAQLLDCLPDPVLILNQQRQIALANRAFADLLQSPAEELVGLRLGEALDCVHCDETPGGCGTGAFCRYCGAVQAMVEGQRTSGARVEECRIMRESPHEPSPLDLRVWATPLPAAGPFTVFAIKDISDEKRRAVLERIFLHDVLNPAASLLGIVELWKGISGPEAEEISATACDLAEQIIEEIRSARDLTAAERGELVPELREINVAAFLASLRSSYSHYASQSDKRLVTEPEAPPMTICSDEALLRRVLGNLIKNALESSEPGQTVTVRFEGADGPSFTVHNHSVMSEPVQRQIFQRSFTTKGGPGRGIGTFSVKILTERYLKGTVSFTSTPAEGTIFTVQLPAGG